MRLAVRKAAHPEPPPVDETTTFPKLLAELDRRYGDSRVAVQEKRYGIWQPTTWRRRSLIGSGTVRWRPASCDIG